MDAPYNSILINNYIYNALKDNSIQLLQSCNLTPFYVNVYDIRYTLCEKLIAVGNNYIRGKSERLSRHLYDIHKLLGVVKVDNSLRDIFLHVLDCTKERGFDDAIINGNNLEVSIYKALTEDFYKLDYLDISSKFIFDTVDYESAKKSLMYLVDIGLCDTSTRQGLRHYEIIDIKGNKVQYKDILSGYDYTCSKKELKSLPIVELLTNYKLTSDKKLIKRF